MDILQKKLANFDIINAIKIEESDLQFIALKNMYNKLENKELYLAFIIVNSVICYQLSSTWEKYWTEWSEKVCDFIEKSDMSHLIRGKAKYEQGDFTNFKSIIFDFFSDFLPNSKGNKRFVSVKLWRIEKILPFLDKFIWNEKYYYENMIVLRDELANMMNQKKSAKTIVFAVKMFSYWARVFFDKVIYFPNKISIPIDSRLTNMFEKYKWDYTNIDKFYEDLAIKTNIPPLHLDAILWVNYEDIML